MKKIIVALLTVLLVFAFCGCENTSDNETSLNQNTFHMTKEKTQNQAYNKEDNNYDNKVASISKSRMYA